VTIRLNPAIGITRAQLTKSCLANSCFTLAIKSHLQSIG